MSETIAHNTSSHPPLTRAATCPSIPTSPLAGNPWYQQKFELVRRTILSFTRLFLFSIVM